MKLSSTHGTETLSRGGCFCHREFPGLSKKRAGTEPFKELARHGAMLLGSATLTSAGELPFTGIIHVAGINTLWRASEFSIRQSARSAMQIVNARRFASVAFPLIGAGSGGMNTERAKKILLDELRQIPSEARVVVIEFSS